MLSVTNTTQPQMVDWSMVNNELGSMWREAVVAKFSEEGVCLVLSWFTLQP
jgi:hypothetical protein